MSQVRSWCFFPKIHKDCRIMLETKTSHCRNSRRLTMLCHFLTKKLDVLQCSEQRGGPFPQCSAPIVGAGDQAIWMTPCGYCSIIFENSKGSAFSMTHKDVTCATVAFYRFHM